MVQLVAANQTKPGNFQVWRFRVSRLAGMVQFATTNQTWKFPGLGWRYGTTCNGQLGSKFSLHGHSEQKVVFHEANSFQKHHFGQICTKKGLSESPIYFWTQLKVIFG